MVVSNSTLQSILLWISDTVFSSYWTLIIQNGGNFPICLSWQIDTFSILYLDQCMLLGHVFFGLSNWAVLLIKWKNKLKVDRHIIGDIMKTIMKLTDTVVSGEFAVLITTCPIICLQKKFDFKLHVLTIFYQKLENGECFTNHVYTLYVFWFNDSCKC